jgi:hypothetical protein
LNPFINIAIAKEHGLFGAELKLVGVERTKIWPTCTAKGAERTIIWFLLEKALKWRGKLENFGWKPIDKVSGS